MRFPAWKRQMERYKIAILIVYGLWLGKLAVSLVLYGVAELRDFTFINILGLNTSSLFAVELVCVIFFGSDFRFSMQNGISRKRMMLVSLSAAATASLIFGLCDGAVKLFCAVLPEEFGYSAPGSLSALLLTTGKFVLTRIFWMLSAAVSNYLLGVLIYRFRWWCLVAFLALSFAAPVGYVVYLVNSGMSPTELMAASSQLTVWLASIAAVSVPKQLVIMLAELGLCWLLLRRLPLRK